MMSCLRRCHRWLSRGIASTRRAVVTSGGVEVQVKPRVLMEAALARQAAKRAKLLQEGGINQLLQAVVTSGGVEVQVNPES